MQQQPQSFFISFHFLLLPPALTTDTISHLDVSVFHMEKSDYRTG
jgi:hypothetical protein